MIAEQMKAVNQKGYFVFHEAYGYWERHYGMSSKGHFTVSPGGAPAPRPWWRSARRWKRKGELHLCRAAILAGGDRVGGPQYRCQGAAAG